MINDTISDFLTRIRNANLIKSKTVSIPLTRINKQITEILEKQGFIESFQIFSSSSFKFNKLKKNQSMDSGSVDIEHSQQNKTLPKNNLVGKKWNTQCQVNKASQEILLYLKYKGSKKKPCITNLKRISKPGLRIYTTHKDIPKILGGMGIAILSTSKGIMTDRDARFQKIGGEILCSIW